MSKVHARGAGKRTCLQTIRRNRVDFEAVENRAGNRIQQMTLLAGDGRMQLARGGE